MDPISRRPHKTFRLAVLAALSCVYAAPALAEGVHCDIVFSVGPTGSLGAMDWTVDDSAAPGS